MPLENYLVSAIKTIEYKSETRKNLIKALTTVGWRMCSTTVKLWLVYHIYPNVWHPWFWSLCTDQWAHASKQGQQWLSLSVGI